MEIPKTINATISNFPEIVNQHTSPPTHSVAVLAKKIKATISATPNTFDENRIAQFLKQRASLIKSLLNDYLAASLAQTMKILDPSIYLLKRHLFVQISGIRATLVADQTATDEKLAKTQGIRHIQVPLFAQTSLFDGGDYSCILGKFRVVRTYIEEEEYVPVGNGVEYEMSETRKREVKTITLKANLPGSIGHNLRKAYAEALSKYHAVVAELLSDPIVQQAYIDNPIPQPTIRAIWIPTTKAISAKVRVDTKTIPSKSLEPANGPDPAMIMNVGGKEFVVTLWQVDDEEPIENYLKEFTSS